MKRTFKLSVVFIVAMVLPGMILNAFNTTRTVGHSDAELIAFSNELMLLTSKAGDKHDNEGVVIYWNVFNKMYKDADNKSPLKVYKDWFDKIPTTNVGNKTSYILNLKGTKKVEGSGRFEYAPM